MDHAPAVVSDETTAHSAASASFVELSARHHQLDQRLQQLVQKRYLSADEEIEAVRLKKEKLHLKDVMNHLRCG